MKKQLTDWEQALLDVEDKGYGTVRLLVDGINVSYSFGRGDKNILYFMFFIDNNWKGEYSMVDNEYGKRFGYPKSQRMSPKMIKTFSSFYTKKEMKAKIADFNRVLGYTPCHRSAKSVINTLKKNNQSIKLKKEVKDEKD